MNTQVSIDRISIVGDINHMSMETQKLLVPQYNGFKISNTGYVEPIGKGKWRIDFNPNKLTNDEAIFKFLKKMSNRKLTRLDIAFNVFDCPEFMKLRYNLADISEKWLSRGKSLETIYYGSFKSRRLIRQYDKYIEQQQKGLNPPKRAWGRLEIQLRGNMVVDWKAHTVKMIENMVFPNFSQFKYTEKSILHSLQDGTIAWGELSKPTRRKYRNLIKNATDSSIPKTLLELPFQESINALTTMINNYLMPKISG